MGRGREAPFCSGKTSSQGGPARRRRGEAQWAATAPVPQGHSPGRAPRLFQGDLGLCPPWPSRSARPLRHAVLHSATVTGVSGFPLVLGDIPWLSNFPAQLSLLVRSSKLSGSKLISACYLKISISTSRCLVFPFVPGGKEVIINSPCSIQIHLLSSLQMQNTFAECFSLFCTNTRKLMTKYFPRVPFFTNSTQQCTENTLGFGIVYC